MCEDIIALKPDLVFTEKGVSGMDTKSSCNFSDISYKYIAIGVYIMWLKRHTHSFSIILYSTLALLF